MPVQADREDLAGGELPSQGIRRPTSLGGRLPAIPPELIQAILQGDCVAFVGAGFSAAGGIPQWNQLLRRLARQADLGRRERVQLERLVSARTGPDLEQAAQVIEDRLGRTRFVARFG